MISTCQKNFHQNIEINWLLTVDRTFHQRCHRMGYHHLFIHLLWRIFHHTYHTSYACLGLRGLHSRQLHHGTLTLLNRRRGFCLDGTRGSTSCKLSWCLFPSRFSLAQGSCKSLCFNQLKPRRRVEQLKAWRCMWEGLHHLFCLTKIVPFLFRCRVQLFLF